MFDDVEAGDQIERLSGPRQFLDAADLDIEVPLLARQLGRLGIELQTRHAAAVAGKLPERAPRQVLHNDVVGVVVLAAVVDADHVGVLEPGRRLGLTAEALDESGILGEPPVEQLQRHPAPELLILGAEHVGHASAAQAREELILTERRRGGAFDLRLNAGSGVSCSPDHPTMEYRSRGVRSRRAHDATPVFPAFLAG